MLGDAIFVGLQTLKYALVIPFIAIANRFLLGQRLLGLLQIALLAGQLLIQNAFAIGVARPLIAFLNPWKICRTRIGRRARAGFRCRNRRIRATRHGDAVLA